MVGALGLGLLLVPDRAAAQVEPEGLNVHQLRFTGNASISAEVLSAAIATSKSSWFATSPLVSWIGLGAERHFSEHEFRKDVERLRTYYKARGFLEVQVDTVVKRTEQDIAITFRIIEGEPIRVAQLIAEIPDSIPDRQKLVRDLPLKVGEPFDRFALIASADTVQTRLRDEGYPEARTLVRPFKIDSTAHRVTVSLLVDPGPSAVIGEISVDGNRRIDSAFVRSLLALQPGQDFRQRDIAQSQLNLYRSELFRYAAVALDTAHYVSGAGVVPITIQVLEAPFHRVRGAAGYGTLDCFRAGAGWTVRNALGSGQILDVSAQLSKIGVGRPFGAGLENSFLCSALAADSVGSDKANYTLNASFRRPVFLSPSNALTLSLFAERRSEYLVYLREDLGGSVSLVRETATRIPITVTYRLSSGRTEASAVSFCAFFNVCVESDVAQLRQRRPIATLTLGMQRVRANFPLDPTRGSTLSAEITTSSTAIGSSSFTEFTRFIGDFAVYRPLRSVVLAGRVRLGTVFAPSLALGGGTSNFVPPEQRFYAGGPNDVRGYTRNLLGPLVYVVRESALDSLPLGGVGIPEDSVQVAATGGNSVVVANLEVRFPSPIFGDRLRLAAFVDGGSVWQRGGTGPGSRIAFRVTPGLGLRFVTPLGPVRMDAAYNGSPLTAGPLYKVTASGELVRIQEDYQRKRLTGRGIAIQFSVGQAF